MCMDRESKKTETNRVFSHLKSTDEIFHTAHGRHCVFVQWGDPFVTLCAQQTEQWLTLATTHWSRKGLLISFSKPLSIRYDPLQYFFLVIKIKESYLSIAMIQKHVFWLPTIKKYMIRNVFKVNNSNKRPHPMKNFILPLAPNSTHICVCTHRYTHIFAHTHTNTPPPPPIHTRKHT